MDPTDLSRLRALAAESDGVEDPDETDSEAVVAALRSDDPVALRIGSAAARRLVETGAVDPTRLPLEDALGSGDPPAAVAALRATAAAIERDPAAAPDSLDTVRRQLSSDDVAVRAAAATALAAVTDDSAAASGLSAAGPEAIADLLLDHVDDGSPAVRAQAFRGLRGYLGDDTDQATRGVDAAVDALDAGTAELRAQAIMCLAAVADANPERLDGHLPQVGRALADAEQTIRSQAAYVISEFATHDAEQVTETLHAAATLLDDPYLGARQNAAYLLLVWDDRVGGEAFPVDQAGQRVPELLATDVVAVRRNGAFLAAAVTERDARAVAEPSRTAQLLADIGDDSDIDVPDGLIDDARDALEAAGAETDTPTRAETDRSHADDRSTSRETTTQETTGDDPSSSADRSKTAVFSGFDETCDECGTDLSEYSDPGFCPECGREV